MEDVIVKLLDGTEMPKSEVPVGTIYINENGQKVKKVLKPAQPKAKVEQEEQKGLLGKLKSGKNNSGNENPLVQKLRDLAQKNLPKLLTVIPFDKVTAGLNKFQENKGVNVQPVLNFVQGLSNSAKTGDMSGISNFVGGGAGGGFDFSQVKNVVSSLNIPALNKVVDVVEGLLPQASPQQQFNSCLKMACEDGVITKKEEAELKKKGKAAGMTDAEIEEIIKSNK